MANHLWRWEVHGTVVSLRRAKVTDIERERQGAQFVAVKLSDGPARAVCYPNLTGACAVGDELLLNTTAVELGLGTGGYHFVVANLSRPERASSGPGHTMKLRYTPMQVRVATAAECEGPPQGELRLPHLLVVVLPLHSTLPAAAVAFAETAPGAPLSYLMTDGAALPIAFSDTVAELREKGLIGRAVTCGHAFGGDVEAVGLYDGLACAAEAASGGAVLVAPGPGLVGTGTRLGTTALEQGQVVNAVASLGGRSVVAPRLSLADARSRHRGLSHHTVTALTVAALVPTTVALPTMPPELMAEVREALLGPRADGRPGLTEEHLQVVDASRTREWLKARGLWPKTMGRTPDDDPLFFEAAGAAGMVAGSVARPAGPRLPACGLGRP